MPKRPRITLKLATSLDGKIALANGQSEWITGEKSRQVGRQLRSRHDAIAVGANTAVLDNPQLTTRMQGHQDPVRVIFDSHLRLPAQSNLAQTANDVPVVIFCADAETDTAKALKDLGVDVFPVPHTESGLDVVTALDILQSQGINSLLLEGGGTLAASFIKADAIDVIEWFRAPIILGGDGTDAVAALGLDQIDGAYRFESIDSRNYDGDRLERYQRIH